MREMNRLPDLGRASPEEANAGGGGRGRRRRCGRLGPLPILLGEGGGESFFLLGNMDRGHMGNMVISIA